MSELKDIKKYPTPPKLCVYTTTDGSLYSKPEEVLAMVRWVKEMSDRKDSLSGSKDFEAGLFQLLKVADLYLQLLKYDRKISHPNTEEETALMKDVSVWLTTKTPYLFGKTPFEACLINEADELIKMFSSKLGVEEKE